MSDALKVIKHVERVWVAKSTVQN